MLKFRAWDKIDKEMYDWKRVKSEFTMEYFEDDNLIFMQSTGLKDVNGNEIYEGDIIEYNDNNNQKSGGRADDTIHKGPVEFECGAFWVEGELLFDVEMNDSEFKIIGNIYENAELLEEVK